jgi:hypothetical protein
MKNVIVYDKRAYVKEIEPLLIYGIVTMLNPSQMIHSCKYDDSYEQLHLEIVLICPVQILSRMNKNYNTTYIIHFCNVMD